MERMYPTPANMPVEYAALVGVFSEAHDDVILMVHMEGEAVLICGGLKK